MYKRTKNVCVNFVLARVKSVQNFTLFCRESKEYRDFALFGAIFLHIVALYVTFWHFLGLLGLLRCLVKNSLLS